MLIKFLVHYLCIFLEYVYNHQKTLEVDLLQFAIILNFKMLAYRYLKTKLFVRYALSSPHISYHKIIRTTYYIWLVRPYVHMSVKDLFFYLDMLELSNRF